MTKKHVLITLVLCIPAWVFLPAGEAAGEKLFPALEGFEFDGPMETYTPDTLFEYINGGADLFLNYDFVRLYSLRYTGKNGGEITADIYIHADPENGFGIYAQERPEEGGFLTMGTEGYYEEGTLNFFKGPFYVKLSSFDLNDRDEKIMQQLALKISGNIDHEGGYPGLFSKFSGPDSIPGSDKYINSNFMGHSFLNRVYSRDYMIEGKKFTLFAIKGASPEDAAGILETYTGFAKSKGSEISRTGKVAVFNDPYYKQQGKMNLVVKNNILAGMFCNDTDIFNRLAGPVLE